MKKIERQRMILFFIALLAAATGDLGIYFFSYTDSIFTTVVPSIIVLGSTCLAFYTIFGRFMLYKQDSEARKKNRTFFDYVASFIAYGIMTALALGHIAFIDGIAK